MVILPQIRFLGVGRLVYKPKEKTTCLSGILKNFPTKGMKIKLNENAIPLVSDKEYVQINPEFNNGETKDDQTLLIFDNQLCFED